MWAYDVSVFNSYVSNDTHDSNSEYTHDYKAKMPHCESSASPRILKIECNSPPLNVILE